MVKKYSLEAEIWKKSCFELFFLEWLYSKSGNIVVSAVVGGTSNCGAAKLGVEGARDARGVKPAKSLVSLKCFVFLLLASLWR